MRSIKMPDLRQFVPSEVKELNTLVELRISKVLQPKINSKSKELRHYIPDRRRGLIDDVDKYEKDLFSKFQTTVEAHADTAAIVEDVKELLKRHKSRQQQE